MLGVDPPEQYEENVDPNEAVDEFGAAAEGVGDLNDLLTPSEAVGATPGTANHRPNTAFVMMAIDRARPELQDVKTTIREVFAEFGIVAVTADEIEHERAFTDRILEEIETSECHLADPTGERPNVYYEVGHAHARNKRVILCRRQGANLHFDLAHRNVPEYPNITGLREFLRRRVEVITNRPRRA